MLGLDGVISSDINESMGQIEFGVVDDDTAACVRTNLTRMNIPTAAAITQLTEPVRPLGD